MIPAKERESKQRIKAIAVSGQGKDERQGMHGWNVTEWPHFSPLLLLITYNAYRQMSRSFLASLGVALALRGTRQGSPLGEAASPLHVTHLVGDGRVESFATMVSPGPLYAF